MLRSAFRPSPQQPSWQHSSKSLALTSVVVQMFQVATICEPAPSYYFGVPLSQPSKSFPLLLLYHYNPVSLSSHYVCFTLESTIVRGNRVYSKTSELIRAHNSCLLYAVLTASSKNQESMYFHNGS